MEPDLAMPQPIHYNKMVGFDFRPEAVMERPTLAAHVTAISSIWNEIDARITMTLLSLLGAEAKTGMSIYLAITNDGAKRAAMDAICELKLTTEEQTKMRAVLKLVGDRYSDRNNAIHGAWGVSKLYPDALLWSDIREQILLHIELMKLNGPEHVFERQALQLEHQKKMRVWREKDFIETEKRLTATLEELKDFTRPYIQRAFGRVW
jgi:hypothetical protein